MNKKKNYDEESWHYQLVGENLETLGIVLFEDIISENKKVSCIHRIQYFLGSYNAHIPPIYCIYLYRMSYV